MHSFPGHSYARPMQTQRSRSTWTSDRRARMRRRVVAVALALATTTVASCATDETGAVTVDRTSAEVASPATSAVPTSTTPTSSSSTSTTTSTTTVVVETTTTVAAPAAAPATAPPPPPSTEAPAPAPAPEPEPAPEPPAPPAPPAEDPLAPALTGTWAPRLTGATLVAATGCLAGKSLDFTATRWTVGEMVAGGCATSNYLLNRTVGCLNGVCYLGLVRVTGTPPDALSIAYQSGACRGFDLPAPSIAMSADRMRLTLHYAQCTSASDDAVAVVLVDEVWTRQ